MIKTIVWVKKEATGRPNDQRFEIVGLSPLGKILVQSCGNDEELLINHEDVLAVEFECEPCSLTLYFDAITKFRCLSKNDWR